eukprot:GHVS01091732.1.p1 GENE.GHVS01091732.1~~GHVS01091732.1.p1  ORF type:complete len:273 (+),score=81.64 GHVS01091732.1:200-1018(+)
MLWSRVAIWSLAALAPYSTLAARSSLRISTITNHSLLPPPRTTTFLSPPSHHHHHHPSSSSLCAESSSQTVPLPHLLQEGSPVPSCLWNVRQPSAGPSAEPSVWASLSSREVFDKRRVVLFGVPGAFTPTCSSTHLPSYERLHAQITAPPSEVDCGHKQIDGVYCLSVNDSFVMNAWASHLGIEKVQMIPDGNGDFSRAVGLLVEKKNIGFGERSWRYSMVVDNGVVEKLFIEDGLAHNFGQDPFEVSSAENMLEYLQQHQPCGGGGGGRKR